MSCRLSSSRTRRRRGSRRTRVLGLTGSIGMGKSTAARMLRQMGLPLHDADLTVHLLMARGGRAVPEIARAFPETIVDGAVDRRKLGARVFHDPAALRRLERILHPMARQEARRFIRWQRLRRAPLVVLDIPLLFETGGERLCDTVVVVSAPRFVQDRRVLARSDMSRARLARIRRQQLPDIVKRRRADIVVETGLGKHQTLRELRQVVKMLRS